MVLDIDLLALRHRHDGEAEVLLPGRRGEAGGEGVGRDLALGPAQGAAGVAADDLPAGEGVAVGVRRRGEQLALVGVDVGHQVVAVLVG